MIHLQQPFHTLSLRLLAAFPTRLLLILDAHLDLVDLDTSLVQLLLGRLLRPVRLDPSDTGRTVQNVRLGSVDDRKEEDDHRSSSEDRHEGFDGSARPLLSTRRNEVRKRSEVLGPLNIDRVAGGEEPEDDGGDSGGDEIE
jgi:hypothetical protein